jgi:uncharacterized protein (DUF427 family)
VNKEAEKSVETSEEYMAKAIWNKAVLAESSRTQEVEGNQYFPQDSLHGEFLQASDHTSVCSWKGTAHYYHVVVNGRKNENAAWYYPEPKAAAANIKNYVAFWKGVEVET